MSMSFHSASSQHENSQHDALLDSVTSSDSGSSGCDTLRNEVEPTTHVDQFESNGSNLRSRSGHSAPLDDAISIRSISSRCANDPGVREVHDEGECTKYPPSSLLERAVSFLERTASFRSFSHFDSEDGGRGALYDHAEQQTERPAPWFQAVIISTTRKIVLVALLLTVGFSVQNSRLFQLIDQLVFAVESGVHILVAAYLKQRGIEEREVLRCMGTAGTMFYAMVFLVLIMIPL
ncbi:hypothetical protein P692DRAFT_20875171 [Suillus brevipes Sb2]|nr:hypothetical protein P692DRAFT_20875171 [Suillus brevipes Sb2]